VKVEVHKEAKKEEAPKTPGGESGPDPTKLARQAMELDFWKLKLLKPEGLTSTDPEELTQGEKDNNIRARFNGRADQTSLTIWVYAQAESTQRYTIEQLAERALKSWQDDATYKQRLEPEVDKSFKDFPMTKEGLRMKLVGRRAVIDTNIWMFMQCKNERQYQIRIYYSGGTGETVWKKQIEDFLKNFKPLK
jgi:hypothetical protein